MLFVEKFTGDETEVKKKHIRKGKESANECGEKREARGDIRGVDGRYWK